MNSRFGVGFAVLGWLGTGGCVSAGSEFGTGGTSTDAHGAGTGGYGEDGGSDSAADSGSPADTAGTSACSGSDLRFSVVLRDADGQDTSTVSYPLDVTTYARFENGCSGTVKFETPDSCLVSLWSLNGAEDASFAGNCVEEKSTWEVAEDDAIEVSADWGQLARGTWYATAQSNITGSSASLYFTVQ
jgi:hypothetical protein